MATRRESKRPGGLRAVNWPLRDYPLYAIVTLALCCLVAVGAGWLSQSVHMGALSGLALASSMWQLWVPMTTEFGPRGITLSFLRIRRRIAWRDIGHLELCGRGMLVGSRPAHLNRGAGRKLFLPWGKDREAISAFCDEYRTASLQ